MHSKSTSHTQAEAGIRDDKVTGVQTCALPIWKKITNGIPDTAFTRVIREDPNKRGLLYAGTETAMYVSFDNGERSEERRVGTEGRAGRATCQQNSKRCEAS